MKKTFLVITLIFFSACATTSYKKTALTYSLSDYINIDNFCKKYDFKYNYDTIDDMITIFSSNKELRLLLDSSVGYFNGRILYLKRPTLYREGKILIPKDLDKIISSKEVVSFKPSLLIKTIVVDAGHGGRDPGAISVRGAKEKDLNLKVANYVREELEGKGFKVILTRAKDTYLTLGERVKIAKRHNADLFVSIHANSNRARQLKGVEIYHLSSLKFDPDARSVRLAKGSDFGNLSFDVKAILWDLILIKNYATSLEVAHSLYYNFKKLGFKIVPPKQAPFYVLRYAYVPSVLVEIGYLSNYDEEKILRKKHYQRQIAEAIALGVVALTSHDTQLSKDRN